MAPPLRRRPRHLQAVRDLSPAAVVAAAVATATAVVVAVVIVVVDVAVVGVLLLLLLSAATSTAVYQVAVQTDVWLRREIFSVSNYLVRRLVRAI